jgi:hypothetical protein
MMAVLNRTARKPSPSSLSHSQSRGGGRWVVRECARPENVSRGVRTRDWHSQRTDHLFVAPPINPWAAIPSPILF